MSVLVTGGAGYIGSHVVRSLLKAGHEVVVIDDLSSGHREAVPAASSGLARKATLIEAPISDRRAVGDALRAHAVESVMHFAARIDVAESVRDPARYYRSNFSDALAMLDEMREAGVKKLVFSSTAAVYGIPETSPIPEDAPKAPINAYGQSKLAMERALADYCRAYGMACAALRYFNVAGASADGVLGEAHEPETHLIPRVLLSAAGRTGSVEVFGTDYPTPDGTCVRDYVHVDDLAHAHLLALGALLEGRFRPYNVGSEKGFSVREVISACERVTGRALPAVEKPRRAGDPPVLVAGSSRIREELGWSPAHPRIEEMVRHAWAWMQAHPRGYRSGG